MRKKRIRRSAISLFTLNVISIGVAATAAVSICIAIFVSVYSRTLLRDARVNSEQSVQQTTVAINNYLDSMKNKLFMISDMVEEFSTAQEFEQRMEAVTGMQNDICSVTVYDKSGAIVGCAGSGGKLKQTIYKDLSFDRSKIESSDDFSLSKPHVQTIFEGEYPWVVTLAARAKNPHLGGDIFVAIDFKFSEIAKYIDHVGMGRHGYCYIIDKDGDIVYHPQQQVIFSGLKSENSQKAAALSDGVHGGEDVIYALSTTTDGLWRIVGVSFTEELAVERRTQVLNIIAISLFCCAAIALLALGIYSKIVNAPVRYLLKAMEEFEKNADTFRYSGGEVSVKELQELSDSFKHMAVTIQSLMERVHKEETELRKTELKALQAQINPHFLYNTLDSIQWMCEQGNTQDAEKMVGALARLFRISISRGRELITIKDELQHAENYLIIQSYRYKNQFTYSFEVQPELNDYLCNKITIQPLIENAIYHGISRMVDEGEIKVTVKQAQDNDNDILIVVSDNGVGMTDEQCSKILQKERSDSSGIGVKNVNDRLKIYFGDSYGITIDSELDVGTTVTVRIPKIDKEAWHEA